MRHAPSGVTGSNVRRALRVTVVSLLLASGPGLFGCGHDTPPAPVPSAAAVEVDGDVTESDGSGVAGAEVLVSLHRTEDCSSPLLAADTVETRDDGRYAAGPAVDDIGPGFEPRPVCVDVRAEPPPSRPELTAAEAGGSIAELRRALGDQPLDRLEVDLVLPEAGG